MRLPTPSAEHCKMPRQNQINLKISHKSQRETGTALAEQQEVMLAYKLKSQQWRHAERENTEMFKLSASGKQLAPFGQC